MAQLRAYYYNGGNMLELVRFQKEELPKAVGEEEILSSVQMLSSERSRHGEVGKYADWLSTSINIDKKKQVYFNQHIWGL